MASKESSESRRKLLKSIATSSGAVVAGKSLPESWTRPVVDSVILPAHAQTSPPVPSTGPFAGNASVPVTSLESDSIFAQAADILVPQAQALVALENPYVCVTPNAAMDGATVKLYVDEPTTVLYEFTDVPLGGSKCIYTIYGLCAVGADAGKLLQNLGFIKDAQANGCAGCCFLDSITGAGAGRIEICGITIGFDVGEASCSPTINCDQPG